MSLKFSLATNGWQLSPAQGFPVILSDVTTTIEDEFCKCYIEYCVLDRKVRHFTQLPLNNKATYYARNNRNRFVGNDYIQIERYGIVKMLQHRTTLSDSYSDTSDSSALLEFIFLLGKHHAWRPSYSSTIDQAAEDSSPLNV
jgi:hypothetical protein